MFEEFSDFIQKCPTPFHFTSHARSLLLSQGFVEMKESEPWPDIPSIGFSIRDDRSLFAWRDGGHKSAVIEASHCDSPCLILKPKFDEVSDGYRRCRCSNYGGGLYYSWLSRDLRLAGRVILRDKDGFKSVLYDSEKPVATIPSIAIHLDSSYRYSPNEFDLEENFIPIYGLENDPPLIEQVAKKLNVDTQDIVSVNLRFVDAQQPNLINDMLTSQRLDNMQNTFLILKAFLESKPQDGVMNILCVYDNEEIGSSTISGAMTSIIDDNLKRILKNEEELRALKANSLILSMDSNHATHPNIFGYQEDHHKAVVGKGLTIEKNPDYQTMCDMKNEYPLRQAAIALNENIQVVTNKNNSGSGSTIGPMSETLTGILTVDSGAPVLGMHSIRELGSVKDIESGYKISLELYNNFLKYKYPL